MNLKRHTGETKNFRIKQKHSLEFYKRFLDMTSEARAMKEKKMNKSDFIKSVSATNNST